MNIFGIKLIILIFSNKNISRIFLFSLRNSGPVVGRRLRPLGQAVADEAEPAQGRYLAATPVEQRAQSRS